MLHKAPQINNETHYILCLTRTTFIAQSHLENREQFQNHNTTKAKHQYLKHYITRFVSYNLKRIIHYFVKGDMQ